MDIITQRYKICKTLVVYWFYCMALYHSQMRRHVITLNIGQMIKVSTQWAYTTHLSCWFQRRFVKSFYHDSMWANDPQGITN